VWVKGGGTYSQIGVINRRVGLSLFQIPQGDDVEEGMVVTAFPSPDCDDFSAGRIPLSRWEPPFGDASRRAG